MKTQDDSASCLFNGPAPNQLLLASTQYLKAMLLTTRFKVADIRVSGTVLNRYVIIKCYILGLIIFSNCILSETITFA